MEIANFYDDIITLICSFLDKPSLISLGFSNKRFINLRDKILRKSEFVDISIKCGYLNLVQWGISIGCYLNRSMTCSLAAKGGHLNILKWARENGCDWDSCTCSFAAKGGHFDTLKWARANGCDWDSLTCASASKKYPDILKWIRKNR